MVRGVRDLKSFLIERNHADFANLTHKKALGQLLKALDGLKKIKAAKDLAFVVIHQPDHNGNQQE